MGKNRIKLSEDKIKQLIKKSLSESVFGFNGNDFESMGLRNPANDYQINYREIAGKFSQFAKYLQEMREYVDGVEEDAENNIAATNGIRHNVTLRSMWSDDEDEKIFDETLKKVSRLIWQLESAVEDVLEETEYH